MQFLTDRGVHMIMLDRNKKPKNLTPDEWERVKKQADEWGAMLVHAYPGTSYIKEGLTWDYSNNSMAITDWAVFGENANGEHYLYTTLFCTYLR